MLNSIRREVHSNQALESISTDVFNGVTMSYVGGRSTTIEIKGNNKLAKIEKHAFRGVVHPEEDDFSINQIGMLTSILDAIFVQVEYGG